MKNLSSELFFSPSSSRGKACGKRLEREERYLVGFPPTEGKRCAVSSGITTIPSTRESQCSKNVCIQCLNSFSLLKKSQQPRLSLCCRQFNETENRRHAADIYRNKSWEVHMKGLGIHFTEEDRRRGVKIQAGSRGNRGGETGKRFPPLKATI